VSIITSTGIVLRLVLLGTFAHSQERLFAALMAISTPQLIQLSDSQKTFARLQVPGLSWYIYSDHGDFYYRNDNSHESILVLELSINPSSNALVLGGVEISLIEKNPTDKKSDFPTWNRVGAIQAWHASPDMSVDLLVKYLNEGVAFAEVIREVVIDVEFSYKESEIRINPTRLVGAGRREGKIEGLFGDDVPVGKGGFMVRVSADAGESSCAVVAQKGLEFFDHTTPRVSNSS